MAVPVDAMLECAWFWGIRFDASTAGQGFYDDQYPISNKWEQQVDSSRGSGGSSALPIRPLPPGANSINGTPSFLFSMSMSPRFGDLSEATPSDSWVPSAGAGRNQKQSFECHVQEEPISEMEAVKCVGFQPAPEYSTGHVRQETAREGRAADAGYPAKQDEEDLEQPLKLRHHSDLCEAARSGLLPVSRDRRASLDLTPPSFAPLCLLTTQPMLLRDKEYLGSIASAVTPLNSGVSLLPESFSNFARMSASSSANTSRMTDPVLGSALALEKMMGVTLPGQSYMEGAKQSRSKEKEGEVGPNDASTSSSATAKPVVPFDIWNVAASLSNTMKARAEGVLASVQDTDWKNELMAFSKEVKGEADMVKNKADQVVEQLPGVVNELPKQAGALSKNFTESMQLSGATGTGGYEGLAAEGMNEQQSAGQQQERVAGEADQALDLKKVGATLSVFSKSLFSGTKELLEQVRDAVEQEIAVATKETKRSGKNATSSTAAANRLVDVPGGKYNRFESEVSAMQRDSSTYCDEPEDKEEYMKWRETFSFMAELQSRIVPIIVEEEDFWSRYFFRLHKLKAKEEQRIQMAERAKSATLAGDEDLDGWGDLDDDEEEEVGIAAIEKLGRLDLNGWGDLDNDEEEEDIAASKGKKESGAGDTKSAVAAAAAAAAAAGALSSAATSSNEAAAGSSSSVVDATDGTASPAVDSAASDGSTRGTWCVVSADGSPKEGESRPAEVEAKTTVSKSVKVANDDDDDESLDENWGDDWE
eukprot:gene12554-15776_t